MKAKLIKHEKDYYCLLNDKGEVIADVNGGDILKLSIKNCQAIERGYDLDEIAKEETDLYVDEDEKQTACLEFKLGFQKALEILGDKKFTEEDMKKMYNKGVHDAYYTAGLSNDDDNSIKSLQQNEWDVEIETEVIPDLDSRPEIDGQIFSTNKKIVPKFDEDSCLVLKLA